jgi:hypothetical protein
MISKAYIPFSASGAVTPPPRWPRRWPCGRLSEGSVGTAGAAEAGRSDVLVMLFDPEAERETPTRSSRTRSGDMAAPRQQAAAREKERFATEWTLFDQSGDAPPAGPAPVSPPLHRRFALEPRRLAGWAPSRRPAVCREHPGIWRQPQLGESAACGQQVGELIRG